MTQSINLSGGRVALIDDEDFARVSQHSWHAAANHDRGYYAITNMKREDGRYTTVRLHRFILDAKPGEHVDHRNRDGLDNRRDNLRKATRSLNAANSKHRADRSSSKYRGVYAVRQKFRAQIRVNGRLLELGRFSSAEAAALSYNSAARQHFGEFAVLNEI